MNTPSYTQTQTITYLQQHLEASGNTVTDLQHETDDNGIVWVSFMEDGSPVSCYIDNEGVCHWL